MAEGRTLDNLTNGNFLFQDYSTSIEYFDKRLAIAKECKDQTGQCRAHRNLGNAYLHLEDFDKALHHYREAMHTAELMKNGLFVAQMNFIIGRVYNLKQEYEPSIYFHEKHLNLAKQFNDSKGQCQGYFTLSQLNEKINQYDKSKKYLSLYQAIEREVDDSNEQKSEAQNNSLKTLHVQSINMSLSESHLPRSGRSNSSVSTSLVSPTDGKSIASKKLKTNFMQHLTKKSPLPPRKQSTSAAPDELVDLVCRMQKSRFDDQRCDIKTTNHQHSDRKNLHAHRSSTQLDDIMNTVDRLQQLRLDDQRTNVPSSTNSNTKNQGLNPPNDHFFDQLAKSQESRMNDQRAVLLPLSNNTKPSTPRPMSASPVITTTIQTKNSYAESTSKTLPDEEFFSLLNRLQTRRIDQQRTSLPSTINSPTKQTRIKS